MTRRRASTTGSAPGRYASSARDPLQLSVVFTYGAIVDALRNSALVATIFVVLTALVAWSTPRTRVPGRWLLEGLAFAPIAVPGTVIGVSVLPVYLTLPTPPGFIAAWITIVAISFSELSATIFLASPQSRFISVVLYSTWADGNTTAAASIGVVILVVVLALALIARLIGRRFRIAE